MKKIVPFASCALLATLACANTSLAQLKVQPDKNNVVGSKLDGNWVADRTLNKRLGYRGFGVVGFKSDAKVATMVPAKYAKFFKNRQIYLAGYMTLKEKKIPFVLTQLKGNPHVVFFLERGGDPFGNPESFNVMLAVAKDTQNDLLFIGGDFNNQPFAAYRREKSAPKKKTAPKKKGER